VNTRARSGEEQFQAAGRELAVRGIGLAAALPVKRPQRLPEAAREALSRGARTLIVGGGDGTFSAVANVLACREVALGVLPLGTGNDFARSLGIPLDLAGACEVIARGRVREVDLGRIGDRYFINAASVGVTTAVARRMRTYPTLKRRLGPLAYPAAAAGELLTARPFRARLELGARRIELDALQIVVGNGRFHGAGRLVAPEAGLRDRLLDVYAVVSGGEPAPEGTERATLHDVLTLARVAWQLRDGSHVAAPEVLHLRVGALRLETEPAQDVNVDGEITARTPIRFGCVPRGLRVLVPDEGPG
jgi:diacylglycerol kinase (ATP)